MNNLIMDLCFDRQAVRYNYQSFGPFFVHDLQDSKK
jgi:hypothetical protein